MTTKEELELVLNIIRKYNLPLSPILEYAINEKIDENSNSEITDKKDVISEKNNEIPYRDNGNEQITTQVVEESVYEIPGCSIENYGNHSSIVDSNGCSIFSTSGRLKVLGGKIYGIRFAYSSLSVNIINKLERDLYTLGKRIIYAQSQSPLYKALNEKKYLEQIRDVRYDATKHVYCIQIDNIWYDNFGCNIDDSDVEPNSIATTQKDITNRRDKNSSKSIRIIEYGERTIAVIGNTRPCKNDLKAMGGYFVNSREWGPAWVFWKNRRERIEAYVYGDTSVVDNWEDKKTTNKSSRYHIRVEYPNGNIFFSTVVWETLVDVVKYAGADNVMQLNIVCMGDNLVSPRLNENPIYRNAQKQIGGGMYVNTYSSTDTKFRQITKINKSLNLGLKVEKVFLDEENEKHSVIDDDSPKYEVNDSDIEIVIVDKGKPTEDKRIGYTVRLFPSQEIGEIVRVRTEKEGVNKLIVKTENGIKEVDDLPYMYEVLKRY